MSKQQTTSTSTKALSIFLGRALLPGKDGRPQRKLTAKEAYEKAVELDERRRNGLD